MSIFRKILDKLGMGKHETQSPQAPPPASVPRPADSRAAAPATASAQPPPTASTQPSAIGVVDVVGNLEGLAADRTEKLNWKTSIVDLLKLLGLDSSLEARKELATELGAPADKMHDSAQMNMWLHKTVLQKLADNGGNIPREML